MVDFKDPETGRIDFRKLADAYNHLSPGQVIYMPRLTNTTHFRNALKRRGLINRVDFKVTQQATRCVLKRFTDKSMQEEA